MIIGINGNEIEAGPENSVIFTGETLLNGIYIDDDDDYLFIPQDIEAVTNYPELALRLKYEGVPVYELEEYDPFSPPFCFVINALCRVFQAEIEDTFSE